MVCSTHRQGDGVCGFASGIERLQYAAEERYSFAELCDSAYARNGHISERTGGGTYLSEDGCGVHRDNTDDHEMVFKMLGGRGKVPDIVLESFDGAQSPSY